MTMFSLQGVTTIMTMFSHSISCELFDRGQQAHGTYRMKLYHAIYPAVAQFHTMRANLNGVEGSSLYGQSCGARDATKGCKSD